MEEWRDIEGYEGLYQVSNEGRVKSLERSYTERNGRKATHTLKERILRPSKNSKKYCSVMLSKNGSEKRYLVHRLVAQAFVPNPNDYPAVNHKDENPKNNKVENLEWCTYEYNSNYGTRNERISIILINREDLSKRVYQWTLDGKLVKIWKSTNECGRNGFCQNLVAACCRGERKTHKGHKWSYEPL